MSRLFIPDTEVLTLEELTVSVARSPSMTYVKTSLAERLFGSSLSEAREYSILRTLVTPFALPYSPYLPTVEDLRAFGVDVSVYQGIIDFILLAANAPVSVEYIMIRMGQSWGYQDPNFVYNWNHAKQSGIPRMAYHVIHPGQPIDVQVAKVMNIWNIVGNDFGEGPLWIDLELSHDQSPNTISTKTWEMIQRLRDQMGHDVAVYSADWFLSGYCEPQDWWNEVWWWLAHYLHPSVGQEHVGPPARPEQISPSKVAFHQTSSYGDGNRLGVESLRLDFNRYMLGATLPLREFLTLSSPPPSPPPSPSPELEVRVAYNEGQIQAILLMLEEVQTREGLDRARVDQLIRWAQSLNYSEA